MVDPNFLVSYYFLLMQLLCLFLNFFLFHSIISLRDNYIISVQAVWLQLIILFGYFSKVTISFHHLSPAALSLFSPAILWIRDFFLFSFFAWYDNNYTILNMMVGYSVIDET